MTSLGTTLKSAEAHCQAQGTRLTEKRKRVLKGLLQANKALSAYELTNAFNATYDESMPPMSVYRILEFLRSQDLVHKLSLANKYIACAHISCDHQHGVPQFLICGQCQMVKEVSIDHATMAELKQTVTEAGFQLQSQQLELDCVCKNCLKK